MKWTKLRAAPTLLAGVLHKPNITNSRHILTSDPQPKNAVERYAKRFKRGKFARELSRNVVTARAASELKARFASPILPCSPIQHQMPAVVHLL